MALERIKVWIEGEILTASDLNAEFDNIVDFVNTLQSGIDSNTANITTLENDVDDINADILAIQAEIDDLESETTDLVNALVPVGTIIPFYDFNAAVTFNTNYWKYCNGATVSDLDSPLNGLVLPNLSGRYIVGYGTDAGTDIGTATWDATVTGNTTHQINLAHTHTSAAHQHTLGSHTHDSGTLKFKVAESSGGNLDFFLLSSSQTTVVEQSTLVGTTGTNNTALLSTQANHGYYTVNGSGSSDGPSTNNTSSVTPGATGSSLSATQSIQPSSIRVRYLIRYK